MRLRHILLYFQIPEPEPASLTRLACKVTHFVSQTCHPFHILWPQDGIFDLVSASVHDRGSRRLVYFKLKQQPTLSAFDFRGRELDRFCRSRLPIRTVLSKRFQSEASCRSALLWDRQRSRPFG